MGGALVDYQSYRQYQKNFIVAKTYIPIAQM